MIDERKMSKQPPPAPTASAVGPCPTVIQISRTPRHWKFTQHHRTTRPPPLLYTCVWKVKENLRRQALYLLWLYGICFSLKCHNRISRTFVKDSCDCLPGVISVTDSTLNNSPSPIKIFILRMNPFPSLV